MPLLDVLRYNNDKEFTKFHSNVIIFNKFKKGGIGKMLLPGKYLHEEKSLLQIGARILLLFQEPETVSFLWSNYQKEQKRLHLPVATFDLFVLSLDILYIIGAIEYQNGRIRRNSHD